MLCYATEYTITPPLFKRWNLAAIKIPTGNLKRNWQPQELAYYSRIMFGWMQWNGDDATVRVQESSYQQILAWNAFIVPVPQMMANIMDQLDDMGSVQSAQPDVCFTRFLFGLWSSICDQNGTHCQWCDSRSLIRLPGIISLHMNENELPVHNNHTIDIYGHVAFTGQLWVISNPFFRLYDSNNIASSSYTAIIYNVYVPMWIWITFFDIIRPDASMYYYSKLLSEIYMEMFNFPSTKAYTTREE